MFTGRQGKVLEEMKTLVEMKQCWPKCISSRRLFNLFGTIGLGVRQDANAYTPFAGLAFHGEEKGFVVWLWTQRLKTGVVEVM